MFVPRFRPPRSILFTLLLLSFGLAPAPSRADPGSPPAPQSSESSVAPDAFADIGMRGKLWPRSGLVLLGPSVGAIVRPFDKCLHFTGEVGAGFGTIDTPGVEGERARAVTLALGAIWGAGTDRLWFGAGAVFDGGWSSFKTDAATDNSFELDAALRAQVRGHLRQSAWVFTELRLGHALVADEFTLSGARNPGQSGALVGLTIGGSLAL